MRRLPYATVVLAGVLLSACHTIEHRSETVTKTPLPVLSKNAIQPKQLWVNSKSAGVGKNDAKLQLALSASHIMVADHQGRVIALQPETGRMAWEISTKKAITAGPEVKEGKIFLGTHEGEVLAYQEKAGEFLWQANFSGAILAAPVAANGIAFVHGLDDSVVALSTVDGRQLWRYSVSTPPLMLRQSSRPVLAKQHVIVGFANGKLVGLHPVDGAPDWQQEISIAKGRSDIQRMNDISADPVVKDGVVYAVSYQGRIAAMQADTGILIWERELSSYSGIAVSTNAVYVSDVGGTVWALNRKTGAVLWKETALSGRQLSAPAIAQDYIIVGDDDGYLHWISIKEGSLVARVLVDSKGIIATPVVKDDIVYVLGKGGKVAAYTISFEHGISKRSQ